MQNEGFEKIYFVVTQSEAERKTWLTDKETNTQITVIITTAQQTLQRCSETSRTSPEGKVLGLLKMRFKKLPSKQEGRIVKQKGEEIDNYWDLIYFFTSSF